MRWKVGMTMHHWMGNPRNKNRKDGLIPHCFHVNEMKDKERIIIARAEYDPKKLIVTVRHSRHFRVLNDQEIEMLAANDGLTIDQFRMWFVPPGSGMWKGWILHWTDKLYSLQENEL